MWNINLEQAESSSAPEEIREIYWHQNVEKGSTAGQKNQQTQNWQGRGWGEARLRPHWPPATYLSFRPRPTLSPYIRSRWPRRSAFTFLCTGSSARACAVSCCSAVLASCPRTNKQRWHPPRWRVSPGSSLRKPVHAIHTVHTMDSWWWRKDMYCTLGTVLSILLWSAHWVLTTMLPARNYYYLHFRDDETGVPGS